MSTSDRTSIAAAVALSAAVAVTALDGGGFGADSQAHFVVLAGAALLAAAIFDGKAAVAAARSRLSLTLAGIAIVALTSCVWSINGVGAALREGLVVAGLAAVFVAAATLAAARGARPFAGGIAALAVLESILALHAVAMHALPQAERIYGVWRPGGTFQYPPALAILELCGLPYLCVTLESRRSFLAAAAAAGATLAGTVLELSGSRLALAMAVVLLALMLLRAVRGHSRGAGAIATSACVLIGASLATTILGGHVGPYAAGAGWSGLLELAVLAVGLGVAWTVMRGATILHGRAMLASSVSLAVIALGGGVSIALRDDARVSSSGTPSLTAGRPASSLLHGRGREWGAALETWMERPLLGAGAGAYARASVIHQGADASLFAHDLPLELTAELGILGALLAIALYVTPLQLILSVPPSPGLWLLAPAVLVILASNLVDWTWHLTGLAAVWALACGALQGERCS
jgi:hypothetical protein